jgi:hypothetical protein
VRVVASAEAVARIAELGGRLYVWPRSGRCCQHGLAWLEAAPEPPRAGFEFEPVPTSEFELFLARMASLPDELHVDVAGFRGRRVAAYWDNCAYVA